MYRTALEAILGFNVRGDRLSIDPCIPRYWSGFEITYRYGTSTYRLTVDNPHGVNRGIVSAVLDGANVTPVPCEIPLVDDGATHLGKITLG
jgi:cyclic beta-1,2-glucan synthetase